MKKPLPYEFILEELAPLSPRTNPMFGAHGIYVGDKIVGIVRERESSPRDNGLWLATSAEHHASLQRDFPSMRSIEIFGKDGPTGWQVLPADAEDFEAAALLACEFIRRGDPRIGKVPKAKNARKAKPKPADKPKAAAKPKRAAKPGAKNKIRRKRA